MEVGKKWGLTPPVPPKKEFEFETRAAEDGRPYKYLILILL